jgi:hypothetical protein
MGDFAFLPIHAAGIYTGPGQVCCADYVVSSYTPTLTTLLDAPRARTVRQMRLITTATGWYPSIQSSYLATKEAQSVIGLARAAGASAEAAPPSTSAANNLALIKLKAADIIHYAGHTVQDASEPLKSRLCFDGSEISVHDLLEAKPVPPAFLAFLYDAAARESPQDVGHVGHLAGAMLFAGFENVVTTASSVFAQSSERAKAEYI